MDNCKDIGNMFPPSFWELLKKIPAFRYLKAPVDNEQQLYEKYYAGNEKGTFAFVYDKNTFYTYHPRGFNRGRWKPISGDIASFFEIDREFLKEGDILIYDHKKEKFVVKSGNVWNRLIGDLQNSFVQVTKFLNQVEEIPADDSDAGIYFIHNEELTGLYLVLGEKSIKIFNSSNFYFKDKIDEMVASIKNLIDNLTNRVTNVETNKVDKSELPNISVGIKQYKEKVTNITDLPKTGNVVGDARVVVNDKDTDGGSFIWLWNGSDWSRTAFTTLYSEVAKIKDKLDKSAVKQVIGTSETDVMSQKAVTDEIAQVRSDLSEKASKNNLKYLVLSYNTDAATTRKSVLSIYRSSGLVVSYNTGSKWVTELYTGTSFADADWTSDSNWKTVGEHLTIEGLNLYELQAPDGAVIMSFDENGRLYSQYVPESIPIEAVNGLYHNLNRLNEVSLSKESNSNIFELKDDLGNIFASIDAYGIFDIPRLRVNHFDFHGEQFDDTSFVKDTAVVFPELKFFKINIEGELAWDTYNRTSVDNVATFYTADNKPLAKFKTKHSIQGATSAAGHAKKGYTLDLFNNDWNPVELKIGNMISVDSYHTKGFWGDCTHTRDVGNGRFYWEIAKTRKYPNNLIRNVITTIPTAFNNKTSAVEDAIFASNGIPFAMYHHGVFFGLYTFRLKKTRLNYALNNKNENHIFIDSWMAGVGLGDQNYADFDEIATKYEIRSPKNITTNVRANVERFFSYMKEVFDGTKDLATTYQDYIILDAWIDWKIQAEIIGHWDSVTNNAAYITYDGLKWWPVMADTDNTLGLRAYSTPITTSTEIYIYNDIWKKFNATFLPQIKARYKELRDNGVISDASAKKIFGGISENIPYYVYEQDFAKWGSWSGSPIIMDSLYTFYHNRMNYLDSIWMD